MIIIFYRIFIASVKSIRLRLPCLLTGLHRVILMLVLDLFHAMSNTVRSYGWRRRPIPRGLSAAGAAGIRNLPTKTQRGRTLRASGPFRYVSSVIYQTHPCV